MGEGVQKFSSSHKICATPTLLRLALLIWFSFSCKWITESCDIIAILSKVLGNKNHITTTVWDKNLTIQQKGLSEKSITTGVHTQHIDTGHWKGGGGGGEEELSCLTDTWAGNLSQAVMEMWSEHLNSLKNWAKDLFYAVTSWTCNCERFVSTLGPQQQFLVIEFNTTNRLPGGIFLLLSLSCAVH